MLQQASYKNLLLLTEDFDIEIVYVKLGTISGYHCTEMMIVWSPLIGPTGRFSFGSDWGLIQLWTIGNLFGLEIKPYTKVHCVYF